MKKIKSIALLLAVAALVLSSCSNDVLLADETGGNGPGTNYSGKTFFLNAGIALPTTATRSATQEEDVTGSGSDQTNSDVDSKYGEDDYEYGYDSENDVRTMLLVFTTATADEEGNVDKFLFATEVSGIEKAPTGQSNYAFNVLAEVKYEDLQRLYAEGGIFSDPNGNRNVNVYAFCNYTANLEKALMTIKEDTKLNKNYLGTSWIDEVGTITESASKAGKSPVINNTIWAERSFLMTNYTKNTVEFPKNLNGSKKDNEGWDDYSDKDTPFHITKYVDESTQEDVIDPILVERSAARIDFRDGSTYYLDDDKEVKVSNAYPVETEVHLKNSTGDQLTSTHNLYSVQLTRMALVNMSKNFYYLRRVSDDPTAAEPKVKVGGKETSKNYVVDSDAADKKINSSGLGNINKGNASEYFNFPLYDEEGNYNKEKWYVDAINDVTGRTVDNWSGNTTNYKDNPYHIWRYVTENTLPNIESQITVQSTGIVFKGRIIAGKEYDATYSSNDETVDGKENYLPENVRKALGNFVPDENTGEIKTISSEEGEALPILYSFDGFLYAGWEELVEYAVKDGQGGRLYTAVKNILNQFSLMEDGKTYSINGTGEELNPETAHLILTGKDEENRSLSYDGLENSDMEAFVRNSAADNEIAVYVATDEDDGEGWGYYCYYFYWNRHNDNNKSGEMGTMEFATVRNNVYKITVEEISKFGHPINRGDDPDPVEEDDPDEEPLKYIQVDVEVLPWVVRVNNVKF